MTWQDGGRLDPPDEIEVICGDCGGDGFVTIDGRIEECQLCHGEGLLEGDALEAEIIRRFDEADERRAEWGMDR